MTTTVEDTRKLTPPSVGVTDPFTEETFDATVSSGSTTGDLLTQIISELKIMNFHLQIITEELLIEGELE